jgi:ribosomal protein L11 methyltransferase
MEAGRRWLILSVLAPPRGEEFLLVDALRRLGAQAVSREGERVVAWLPDPGDVDALVRRAEAAVRASTSLPDAGVVWRWESHEEWAARWTRELPPRRASDRIVVAPVGAEIDAGVGAEIDAGAGGHGDPIVIRLSPSTAFGTAEHPSTRASLRFLEGLVRPGDWIADVGAGTGILAIAAAGLGATRVIALESDAEACAAARTNVAINGLAHRVEVRHMLVTASDLARLDPCQGIVANLEAAALRPLLPALAAALPEGGWLVVAGLLRAEREVMAAAAPAELTLGGEVTEAGWWAGWWARG